MKKRSKKTDVEPGANVLGIVCALLLGSAVVAAQPSLQITSPTNGTVINSGQTVTVTVTAVGSFRQVILGGTGKLGLIGSSEVAPYQFSMAVPADATPGRHYLTAVGQQTEGDLIYSSQVMIDIERSDSPVSLVVDPESLSRLRVGESIPLRVVGTFADDSTADLQHSTRTAYVSEDLAVAKVSADGLVTAIGSGTTQIIVNGSVFIPVTVLPPIAVTPDVVSLSASQFAEFIADVSIADDPSVTWTLNPPVGSVSLDGVYTAPASLSVQQTIEITATSVADPTKSASAFIDLSPEESVTVLPEWSTLYAGQQQQFQAVMINAGSSGVVWSISPAGSGTIDNTGRYTAPGSVNSLQSVTVTATSVSTPSISGSRTFYLSAQPFALLAQKPSLFVAQGGSNGIEITELATGGFPHPVSFSVSGLPAGVTGSFNNPTLTGLGSTTLTVVAAQGAPTGFYEVTITGTDTVYAALSKTVSFTVVVGSGFTLSVSSPTLTLPPRDFLGH